MFNLTPPMVVQKQDGSSVEIPLVTFETRDSVKDRFTTATLDQGGKTLSLWSGDKYNNDWQQSDADAEVLRQITADPSILVGGQ